MKKTNLFLLLACSALVLSACGGKGGKEDNISSEEDSSSESIYTGPTSLFVAFFLDYNVADFDNPYYSYLTEQNTLLHEPEKCPTAEDAPDKNYPIFKGWSSHTVIDDDSDLWNFETDVVGYGERSYLYFYGIWEADESEDPTPSEYVNYVMYRNGGDWSKKEMQINPGNNNEYMLKGFEVAADTELVFCIDDEWFHYGDLKAASIGVFEESPEYAHDDGNTYSDSNIIVKQAGKYDIYLDYTADKDTNNAIYMARDTSGDPVTEKVLYLAPGVWSVDNPRYAAYVFGGAGGTAWFDLTKEGDYYKVTIAVNNYPKIIFVRMKGSSSENNWDNKMNQTSDLTIGDYNLYTITGWGEGGISTGSWNNKA